MENQTTNPIIGYVLLDSFNNEDDLVPVLTDQDTAKLWTATTSDTGKIAAKCPILAVFSMMQASKKVYQRSLQLTPNS